MLVMILDLTQWCTYQNINAKELFLVFLKFINFYDGIELYNLWKKNLWFKANFEGENENKANIYK
jgi:hypothetical protein